MKTSTMMTSAMPNAPVGKAWEEVSASFDRFCLAAGIETLGAMMEADAGVACGPRHSRSGDRRGHRWGRTVGKIGFHAGKVAIERPRVRGLDGKELALTSWEQAIPGDRYSQTFMPTLSLAVLGNPLAISSSCAAAATWPRAALSVLIIASVKAVTLHKTLGVSSLAELEQAAPLRLAQKLVRRRTRTGPRTFTTRPATKRALGCGTDS
jgi:hypothetical protein